MAETKRKGDLGEVMVLADALRRGYKAAIPVGEDWRYDLIVLRKGRLERVQCKYVKSNGDVVRVACLSANSHAQKSYTSKEIDWIAVYDETSDKCYYIPSSMLGDDGRTTISLRISPTKNRQKAGLVWAKDFENW